MFPLEKRLRGRIPGFFREQRLVIKPPLNCARINGKGHSSVHYATFSEREFFHTMIKIYLLRLGPAPPNAKSTLEISITSILHVCIYITSIILKSIAKWAEHVALPLCYTIVPVENEAVIPDNQTRFAEMCSCVAARLNKCSFFIRLSFC